MPLLAALLLVIVLLGVMVAAYAHLAGRLARLEEANELLLDLVSTQMTLGPADAARLGLAAGADRMIDRPLATRRAPPP